MSALTPRVCIVGAGPAGMSCALWLHNLGLAPTLVDCEAAAGGAMLLNFLNNNWVLGQRDMSGPEMASRFAEHIRSLDLPLLLESRIGRIDRHSEAFRISLETSNAPGILEADAIVLATGTRYRGRELMLGLPGFADCDPGRLRYGPHSFTDIGALAGRRLLVVGGGDNALENALLAVQAGSEAVVLARGQFRAQTRFLEALRNTSGCTLHAGTRLASLRPAPDGLLATLEGASGMQHIEVDRIHLLAGYTPNSGFVDDVLGEGIEAPARDAAGYLLTDSAGRSSCAGFYAAGDVANPAFPNILSALAQGAQVARTVEADFRSRHSTN